MAFWNWKNELERLKLIACCRHAPDGVFMRLKLLDIFLGPNKYVRSSTCRPRASQDPDISFPHRLSTATFDQFTVHAKKNTDKIRLGIDISGSPKQLSRHILTPKKHLTRTAVLVRDGHRCDIRRARPCGVAKHHDLSVGTRTELRPSLAEDIAARVGGRIARE